MMRYADKVRQDYDWLYDKPAERRRGIEWHPDDERDFARYLVEDGAYDDAVAIAVGRRVA